MTNFLFNKKHCWNAFIAWPYDSQNLTSQSPRLLTSLCSSCSCCRRCTVHCHAKARTNTAADLTSISCRRRRRRPVTLVVFALALEWESVGVFINLSL